MNTDSADWAAPQGWASHSISTDGQFLEVPPLQAIWAPQHPLLRRLAEFEGRRKRMSSGDDMNVRNGDTRSGQLLTEVDSTTLPRSIPWEPLEVLLPILIPNN